MSKILMSTRILGMAINVKCKKAIYVDIRMGIVMMVRYIDINILLGHLCRHKGTKMSTLMTKVLTLILSTLILSTYMASLGFDIKIFDINIPIVSTCSICSLPTPLVYVFVTNEKKESRQIVQISPVI